MELKVHTQLDESCIYYVLKYYTAVCHHSENTGNILPYFFLRHLVQSGKQEKIKSLSQNEFC